MAIRQFISQAFVCMCSIVAGAEDTISNSINKKPIDNSDSNEFTFLVAGHVYGSSHNTFSVFPCPSLLSNIDKINNSNALLLILLGDNYRQLDNLNINAFKSSFLDKIKMPVFNAVGNHDITPDSINNYHGQDYSKYKEVFGNETYYSFVVKSSLFVILDTELAQSDGQSDGSIKGEQFKFLSKTLKQSLGEDTKINNIFICAHKELNLWNQNNFQTEVLPLFDKAKETDASIYILSGDMGKNSADLYIDESENPKINYIHTHLADNRLDKILKFKVSSDSAVEITPISLTGLPVKKIDDYVLPANRPKSQVLEMSFATKVINRFNNRSFYEGILFSIFVILLIFVFVKRFNSR
jgi:hypothetical protein